ncbi:MAG: hypothetical protein NT062_02075 [Proteobacteria bacterium]|nr:hypothetical protein [Pseudomonadota bacterium]
MIESFVDLTYRGLSLQRRVKLARVRPTTGYLEVPAPMPVGTTISIATDDGLAIEAKVLAIHEQVGGSDQVPGMNVAPLLVDPAIASWWTARVALPDEVVAPPAPPVPVAPLVVEAAPPTSVKKRTTKGGIKAETPPTTDGELVASAPESPIEGAEVPRTIDEGKKTVVMDAVDPALLEQLLQASGPNAAAAAPEGGDGRTMVMPAVDLSALGLETGTTGEMPIIEGEVTGEVSTEISSETSDKPKAGSVKRRRAPKPR